MKKSLIAMAAASAVLVTAPAFAQSSVTLFGVVDATLARGTGSLSSKTQLTDSGYNSSRLGFRGVEDLGGGMSASFWLEARLHNDNGTGNATNTNNQASGASTATAGTQGIIFDRRSTLSLSGNWGEIRLGRDYSPQFLNIADFDPFGTNGVGTTQTLNSINTGVTSVRVSNSIGYILPRQRLEGVYGQVQYWLGENSSNAVNVTCTAVNVPAGCGVNIKNDGTGYGMKLGYENGPVDVAMALSRTHYAAGNVQQNNVAGQWNFGFAKIMGEYSFDRNEASTSGKARGYVIGSRIPFGPHEVRFSYSRYKVELATSTPTSKKFAIGYDYSFSKRTIFYVTYASLSNSGGASAALNGATTAANKSSNGLDVGLRHSF